jgi:hypothetical protein
VELFRKFQAAYSKIDALGRPPLDEDNRYSMVLRNGSRVIALPGAPDRIRGFSAVDLVLIDEAAFVMDVFYTSVLPMVVVSGGQIILMSTPHARQGFFFEAWEDEDRGWDKVKVTALDCPRITAEAIEQARKDFTAAKFKQEFFCEFGEVSEGAFSYDLVKKAFTDDVTPLF